MEFRPCIDIHNGKVKQIVGSSLSDAGDYARENFVAEQDAVYFARMYEAAGLRGGHVILLNASDSPYYKETKAQALAALRAYPGGLMVGGGITAENAAEFLEAGASHVIVTSYVFREGRIDYERLNRLVKAVGKEHLVLDLSCRRRSIKGEDICDDICSGDDVCNETGNCEDTCNDMDRGEDSSNDVVDGLADRENLSYYIVTDRWQKFTQEQVTAELLDRLAAYCSEFLVHAVDVEGKGSGIEVDLARILGAWGKIPITYAGGVRDLSDLTLLRQVGRDRLHVTVGSALDIFGGHLSYRKVLEYCGLK